VVILGDFWDDLEPQYDYAVQLNWTAGHFTVFGKITGTRCQRIKVDTVLATNEGSWSHWCPDDCSPGAIETGDLKTITREQDRRSSAGKMQKAGPRDRPFSFALWPSAVTIQFRPVI
jgi:hypothetical protein